MTPTVVVADPHSTIRDVAALMRDGGVGSVVLVQDGRPVGFITDRDVAVSVVAQGRPFSDRVSDHASSPVITVAPDMEVDEAAHVMTRQGVRRLVVVEAGFLVAVVTLDDLASRLTDRDLSAHLSVRITRAALPDYSLRLRAA